MSLSDEQSPLSQPRTQLLLFLCCFMGGGILATIAATSISSFLGIGDLQQALIELQNNHYPQLRLPIKIILGISHLCIFALPAYVFGRILYHQAWQQRYFLKSFSIAQFALALLFLCALFPLVQWIYYANYLAFPPDAATLKSQELQKVLLAMETPMDLVANLVVVGVFAGVGEELLFRGALQRVLAVLTTNAHVIIWVTAVAFSAVHWELQAFVPRLLLGAAFGYMLLRTGSLWVPILLHTFFNSIQLIASYFWTEIADSPIPEPPALGLSIGLSVLAAVLGYLFWRQTQTTAIDYHS